MEFVSEKPVREAVIAAGTVDEFARSFNGIASGNKEFVCLTAKLYFRETEPLADKVEEVHAESVEQ